MKFLRGFRVQTTYYILTQSNILTSYRILALCTKLRHSMGSIKYLLNELCKDEQGVPVTNRKGRKSPSVPNR